MTKIRAFFALLLLAAVAAACAPAGGSSTPAAQGVYGSAGGQYNAAFESETGTDPTYSMDFLDGTSWSTITSSSIINSWKGTPYHMIWGVDMLPGTYSPNSNPATAGGSCYGLTQEATGQFNLYFENVAQNLITAGQANAVIRIGWEFNLGWTPWSANGCASAFVGAYQQVVDAFRAVGSAFTFEWNPTYGDQGVGNLTSYYPGNSYVTYVGLDVYDTSAPPWPGEPANWNNILSGSYGLTWLASFAATNSKQIVLPEWGLWSSSGNGPNTYPNGGGDDPYFINSMATWISQNNVFEENFWDDTNNLASYPNSEAAFKADFGGSSTPPPTTTTTTTAPPPPPTTTTTTTPVVAPQLTQTQIDEAVAAWLQTPAGKAWIDKAVAEWFQTPAGKAWLATHQGVIQL